MPSDVIMHIHELAILMNGMQGLSLGEEFENQYASEWKMEGMQAQSTIEGVQAQSKIEGVDNNIELDGFIENIIDTIKFLQGGICNENEPEDTLIVHQPQEMATEEA